MESLHVVSGAAEWSELLEAFREDHEIFKSESVKAKIHTSQKSQRFLQVHTDIGKRPLSSQSSSCFSKTRRISPRKKLQYQGLLNEVCARPVRQWDSSTNVHNTIVLRHQILNRTYRPPASSTRLLSQAKSQQAIERLAKATISSKLKTRKDSKKEGASSPSSGSGAALDSVSPIPIPMKRQEGIEMLFYYRKQVQQRLEMDQMY